MVGNIFYVRVCLLKAKFSLKQKKKKRKKRKKKNKLCG